MRTENSVQAGLCAPYFVKLTQARVIGKEGASAEKMPA